MRSSRPKLQPNQAPKTLNHYAIPRARWRVGVLASAVALLGSVASVEAYALALGRITVQSALGEPLQAEIDVADITSEEAASLKVGAAAADRFKSAGLEYSAVMAGLEVNLQRRADGRAYLRLSSNRPVTEPFLDLVLEANWSSGRITRDYTLLFDPPGMRYRGADAVATPTAPVLTRPLTPRPLPAAQETESRPIPLPAPRQQAPVARAPAPQPVRAAGKEPAASQKVTVKAGDTAGRIAEKTKPATVSLDQMLVALLRSNPDAFIGGNINRIKAGAVLDVPGAEVAAATSPSEATQLIVAQSTDFNAFRRKLAQSAPSTQMTGADRQDAGKLQAKVEDRAPATATPDKLTLSKGAIQGTAGGTAEDKIANERRSEDASARTAELAKNISDLNKLGAVPAIASVAAPGDTGANATGTAASAPAISLEVPGTPQAGASDVAVVTAPPVAAAATASAPPVAVVTNPVAAAAPPIPESSLIDEWLAHPLVLPLAGGLLALLAGFGLYRYRQRNKAAQIDSSFLESRLQPDSFFGASGGQRVDTKDGKASGSSVMYSPSQLDTGGDVDPVAEADVYLAYGRDLQAEEILKEALRTTPARVAIYGKLLEIYAKRNDSKAFDSVALDAFNLTQGFGPEWAYIAEMGREVDPSNPIYQPGGQRAAEVHADASTPSGHDGLPMAASVMDVDLDLDLPMDNPRDSAATAATVPGSLAFATEPPAALMPERYINEMDLDFGSAAPVPAAVVNSPPPSPQNEVPPLDLVFPSNGLDFTTEPAPMPEPTAPAKVANSGMMEFDLDSLSLDLGPITEVPSGALTIAAEDPLETKFSLAEEFRTLGDAEGAKALVEEVLAQASGPLKVKAQAFLNALS